IEGMPFGTPFGLHTHSHGHEHLNDVPHDNRNSLLLGISLHKITEALVFTALLVNSGWQKNKAFFWLAMFALVAPAGAFFHYFIHRQGWEGAADFTPALTGVLIGILLHVSTTIIFESEEGHRFNWMKFLSVILGIGMAALLNL
ncbi:MAG: ZIP family metal transporter, partial [Crocinitomicaceae bacterium]|nr:ZIP family metal transporter [Crocinitomicaceae bacterium]